MARSDPYVASIAGEHREQLAGRARRVALATHAEPLAREALGLLRAAGTVRGRRKGWREFSGRLGPDALRLGLADEKAAAPPSGSRART